MCTVYVMEMPEVISRSSLCEHIVHITVSVFSCQSSMSRVITKSTDQVMHMHQGGYCRCKYCIYMAVCACVCALALCEHFYVCSHMWDRGYTIQMTNLPAGFSRP